MTQQITPLPAPPQPSDSPVEFDQKAFALLGGLPQFVNEANTLGGQITALGENSTESAAAALASKNAAATSASNSAGSATASGQSASNSASSANAANQSRIEAQNAAEAAAASAESVDTAYLRNRANHTGTQAIDTVEGLAQAITDAKARANHTGPLNWAWETYGGTANTVTLAPAFARTAYVAGDEFRFRATAANTGATTINVGGLGAKAAVTVTGSALPAGYIRTDVDTVCVYDGTRFVMQREIESGSNTNGAYTRFSDGLQTCQKREIRNQVVAAGDALIPSYNFAAAFALVIYANSAVVFFEGLGSTGEALYGLGYRFSTGLLLQEAWVNTGKRPSLDPPSGAIGTITANSAAIDTSAIGRWY